MSDFSPISFGSTVSMLGNAMTGAAADHDAIANNIANVNTPGYRRETVSFRDALAAAAGEGQSDADLTLSTDDDRQMGGAQNEIAPFDPKPEADSTLQMRADKSNVDVDQEMARLAQNSAYGQTMAQLLQTQYARIHSAIAERVS